MEIKFKRRIVFAGGTKRTRRLVLVTLFGCFTLSGAAQAQSVIAPPPSSVSVMPPAIAALGPGEMQVFPPDSAAANVLDELHPLQWGPVTLRPHASYQFTYGSGIRYSTNQPAANSTVQTFSPGVLFVLGAHWTLDYTPSFTFYSDKNFNNTVGQSVTLTGGTVYEDWILGLSQGFTYSSSPQVQTGEQDAEFGPGPQTAEHTDFAPALEEIEGFLDDVLNEDDFASEGAAPEESTQMTSLNELKRARDSEADLAAAIMASDESEMEMVIEEDGSVTVTGAAELPADRPNEDLADFDFDVEMATSPGLDGASALDFDDATNIGFAPESDPEPELAPPPSASTRPSAAPPPEDQDTAQRPSFFKKLFNR